MDAGQAGGILDRGVIGAGPAIGDVVRHRQRENQRRLQHHADLPAKGSELVLANIGPVDGHTAGRRVEESGQQAEQRRPTGEDGGLDVPSFMRS